MYTVTAANTPTLFTSPHTCDIESYLDLLQEAPDSQVSLHDLSVSNTDTRATTSAYNFIADMYDNFPF